MKHFLLSSLLVLTATLSYGQSAYRFIPADSAAWRYRVYDEDFQITDILLYSTWQDTVANGHTYHKLFSRHHLASGATAYPPLVAADADLPDRYYGAFRDSAGKIYGLTLSGDVLMFDFSAGIGATVPAYGGTTTVTGIDSIAIGGVYHRRWITALAGYTPIEGIGSSFGIDPSLVEPGGSTSFICYSHYDTSYVPDAARPCMPLYAAGHRLGVVSAATEEIEAYPSPVSDMLHIAAPASFDAAIYNVMGQVIWNGRVKKARDIEVGEWPTGVYLLRMQNGNTMVSRRFVKQ